MSDNITDITARINAKRIEEITSDTLDSILPKVLEAAIQDPDLRQRYMARYYTQFKAIFPRASFVINRTDIPAEVRSQLEKEMQLFWVRQSTHLVAAIIGYQCDVLELQKIK